MNKRAQTGDSIMMIYQIVLVSFIALIVLGVSSIFYDHYIDVRDVESRLLVRQVVDCLAPEGKLVLDDISAGDRFEILSYCGIAQSDRLYVEAKVYDDTGTEISVLSQGDGGAEWIRDIYMATNNTQERFKKYVPGLANFTSDISIVHDALTFTGRINVEAIVNHEF